MTFTLHRHAPVICTKWHYYYITSTLHYINDYCSTFGCAFTLHSPYNCIWAHVHLEHSIFTLHDCLYALLQYIALHLEFTCWSATLPLQLQVHTIHYIALHCTHFRCITLHLHYTNLYYITFHYTALHYATLQYMTYTYTLTCITYAISIFR